jgi:4-hydroxy-4-methyl-2-oxoglutarate aldolase
MTALTDELAQYGVSTVYEAAGRTGLVDIELVQVIPGTRAAGPARIARCGQGDNRAVHEAMASLEPGDVLVISMPEPQPVGVIGELLATQAKVHGAAAVLVDAAARDVDELRELGLPVWARWVRSTGATKTARGAIDVQIEVGGAVVRPGDLVILDRDGAVVVPIERADEVAEASRARMERESALRLRLQAGELSYDIYGMREDDAAVG